MTFQSSCIGDRLLRPIVFMHPELIDDSAWLEHIPFAFWLVEALKPRTFVELGTHAGVSFCAFLQAAQKLGLSCKSTAVDTWNGDAHSGTYEADVFARLNEHHITRYASDSRLLKMRFDEALDQFSDGSIDLLHIDGFHTYEAVRHDFEAWYSKMSSRGVVLLHDTSERCNDFGVWRLWEDLERRHPSFEFLHGHGLGMVVVGSEIPDDIQWLTNLDHQTEDQIRDYFAAIGWRYSSEVRERDLVRDQSAQRFIYSSSLERAEAAHAAAVTVIEAQAKILDAQAIVMADHSIQSAARDAALAHQACVIAQQAKLLSYDKQNTK